MKKIFCLVLLALAFNFPLLSFEGYVVHYTKWTIEKVEVEENQKFIGRFYYETDDGVFSASSRNKDWEIDKCKGNSIKEVILSHLGSRVKEKPTYEEEYQRLADSPAYSHFSEIGLKQIALINVSSWSAEEQQKIKSLIEKVENMDF